MDTTPPVRIGILGCSWIAPKAIVSPAKKLGKQVVVLEAVASRDFERAKNYARQHKINRALANYTELIEDPNIDVVYNSLPNSHHKEWTIKALKAGKHVLVEKPIACNENEANEIHLVAVENKKLALEAFHYRFHPLAKRIKEIIDSGELGNLKQVNASFCVPIFSGSDIRYSYDLGGGSVMDTGCYAINVLRMVTSQLGEPIVKSATSSPNTPQVDRHMEATYRFVNSDCIATMKCSIFTVVPDIYLEVIGSDGMMSVSNYIAPQIYYRFRVRCNDGHDRNENFGSWWASKRETTYLYQLESFIKAVQVGITNASNDGEVAIHLPYHPRDAIPNMKLIDDTYKASGMIIRGQGMSVSVKSKSADTQAPPQNSNSDADDTNSISSASSSNRPRPSIYAGEAKDTKVANSNSEEAKIDLQEAE